MVRYSKSTTKRTRSRSRARKPRKSVKARPSRKRTTRKRSTYNRKPVHAGMAYDHSTQGSLAIYRDPFTPRAAEAKIPDGKTRLSVGTRLNASRSLKNKSGGDDILHVLLYPGISQGMVVWGDTGELTNRGFTATQYNNHMTFDVASIYNAGAGADGPVIFNEKISKWRLVSQGLKLQLMNTDEENDGWFQAIRLNDAFQAAQLGFYSGDNVNQQTSTVFGPDLTMLTDLENKNLMNSPTYSEGRLKDIHKTCFELQPQTDDHEFKSLPAKYTVVNGTDIATVGGGPAYVSLQGDTAQAHAIVGQLLDDAFDCVYIRIHCRSNTGAGSTTGSSLRAHIISNQEIVYDEDQSEHKFMTQSNGSANTVAAANSAKRSHAVAFRNNTGV